MGSIVGSALLHGSAIMLLLFAATVTGGIAQLDGLLQAWMGEVMDETFPNQLPAALTWLMAVIIAFGLPMLLMCCRHSWQRLTVWMASLAILFLWAPVLCLAAHRPEITMACLATALAGLLVTVHLYWVARKSSQAS